jgi:hypothetical protein
VRHSTDQTGEHHVSYSIPGIPPATPGINQHSPWADLPPQKNWITANCNLAQQQKEWECWKFTGERGRGKNLISVWTISKQTLERQEGWELVGDKTFPQAGQVVNHRAYPLSQWAAPKFKLPHKMEK